LHARLLVALIMFQSVQQQPDTGRHARRFHNVRQAADVFRDAQAHRQVENFLAQFDHALHRAAAAGDHDAGRQQFLESAAAQLLLDQRIQFLDARLDHLREGLARLLEELPVYANLPGEEVAGDIAKALSLSVKTVSTYRTRLMEKMSLASNSDLTYYALKNKLID